VVLPSRNSGTFFEGNCYSSRIPQEFEPSSLKLKPSIEINSKEASYFCLFRTKYQLILWHHLQQKVTFQQDQQQQQQQQQHVSVDSAPLRSKFWPRISQVRTASSSAKSRFNPAEAKAGGKMFIFDAFQACKSWKNCWHDLIGPVFQWKPWDGNKTKLGGQQKCWVVVTQMIFHFHPYLGRWSNLTNTFQMRWNH